MADSLLRYLQSQPEDFVLRWYCDGITTETPFEASWVDVWFEDAIAWTIVAPWDDDGSDHNLKVEPDLVGLHLYDDHDGGHECIGTAVFGMDFVVDDEALGEVARAQAYAEHGPLWVGAPAWSVACINRVLSEWCLEYVGRMVTVECDIDHGPSSFMARAMATKAAIEAGLEPTYLLVPGKNEGGEGISVRVSEEIMEMLMQSVVDDEGEQ